MYYITLYLYGSDFKCTLQSLMVENTIDLTLRKYSHAYQEKSLTMTSA
jgi:hypothetical protein